MPAARKLGIATSTQTRAAYLPSDTPHYADLPLDRATHIRKLPEELARLAAAPDALFIALHKGQNLVTCQPSDLSASLASASPQHQQQPKWHPAFLQRKAIADSSSTTVGEIFLRLAPGKQGVFAVKLKDDESAQKLLEATADAAWVNLRSEGPSMQPGHAAMLAMATGLIAWHEAEAGAATGANSAPLQGGHARGKAADRPTLFPRLDPAVIMLVACGDYVLLGRQARWAPGRQSLLAGFAEIGETLEQAVTREVAEEAGVAVDASQTRYHSSQPWPFPRSLMIGFTTHAKAEQLPAQLLSERGAQAASEMGLTEAEVQATAGQLLQLPVIHAADMELESAHWFHCAWLAAYLSGKPAAYTPSFTVPGTYSLSGRILHSYVHEWEGRQPPEAAAFQAVPELAIAEGTFKYILVRARVETAFGVRVTGLFVRGDTASGYHADVRDKLHAELSHLLRQDVELKVLGGGRMEHHSEQRVLHIYGYSTGFGQAPHEVTAGIAKRWLPFHDITVSYEGY